ncbi:MAG TPA: 3'-5' exonuclease, partial [Longimicrobiaceae bacterium]|nr:3'-5' exonuclease [Longimicrobiaceae bacterium]
RLDEGDPDLLPELEEMQAVPVRAVDLFLTHVALIADIDQHDANADAVSLMTLHNAKGLEFPFVFVAGMEEGLFPLARAYDEPAQLEEERRLFYVGITRAERNLYITLARRRRRGAEWLDSMPSSFLEAIPSDLLDIRRSPQVRGRSFGIFRRTESAYSSRSERLGLRATHPAPAESRYTVDYSDSQETPRLVKGTRVRHPQFGAGTVADLSGVGADVRAAIDFDSVGRKTVVLRYANLQPDG